MLPLLALSLKIDCDSLLDGSGSNNNEAASRRVRVRVNQWQAVEKPAGWEKLEPVVSGNILVSEQ